MAKSHSPRFLQVANEAKSRVRERTMNGQKPLRFDQDLSFGSEDDLKEVDPPARDSINKRLDQPGGKLEEG